MKLHPAFCGVLFFFSKAKPPHFWSGRADNFFGRSNGFSLFLQFNDITGQ